MQHRLSRFTPQLIAQSCHHRRRCCGRLIAAATLWLCAAFSHGAANAGYGATAQFGQDENQTYTSTGQSSRLAAATNAIQQCELAHPQQSAALGFCELTHMGSQAVTTSRQIRADLPSQAHPLFLWRYQSDSATVYLVGSVHILKPGLYPLAPQLQQAFDSSDYLVLEVNIGQYTPEQLQAKALQYALLPDPQTLQDVLPAETYSGLAEVTAQYGLPLDQMARFKPAFVTQQLAVLALLSAGYDSNQGLENHFSEQVGKREILELETMDFQLDLLMNQDMPTQVQVTRDTLAQMQDFEPLTAQLIRAWLAGDDATFQRVFNQQSGTSPAAQAFMRKLMDERNVGMANRVREYLKGKGTYFVLAGAAHMIGDAGIVSLLEQQGLTATRIMSNQNLQNP